MELHLFEATNGPRNWGKFMVGRPDEEWSWRSRLDPSSRSILRERGWGPEHLWVMDLQTGEGAFFRPGGYAKADLCKHKIWVCVLFERFLTWLYEQDTSDLATLPKVIDFPEVPMEFAGYRRPGPDGE